MFLCALGGRCELRGLHRRTRFSFAQEHLDFVEERGEEVFFLQAGGDVIASVDRTVSSDDDHRNIGILLMHFFGELNAVHAIHAEIGNQDCAFAPKAMSRVLA